MQDRVSQAAKQQVAEYVRQMPTTDPVRWKKRMSKSLHPIVFDCD